jgi:hypothetical protein
LPDCCQASGQPLETTLLREEDQDCSVSAPQAGTYYVMINAYAAYSGVTLVGEFGR